MIHIDPFSKYITPPYVNIFIKQEDIQCVVELLLQASIPFTVYHQTDNTQNQTLTPINTLVEDVLPRHSQSPEEQIKRLVAQKKEIEEIIHDYINKGTEPTIDDIAIRLNVKLSVLKTRFKDAYGKPFYQYYVDKKMEFAAKLLREGVKSARISIQLGYAHPIKFNKMFQKHFGTTPKKYQENAQKGYIYEKSHLNKGN